MNQIFLTQHEAIPHVRPIPGYLGCPVAVRRVDDTGATDFSRTNVHEKQQTFPDEAIWSQYLHPREIGCRRNVLLRFDKLIPVAAFPTFRIGNDAEVIQDMFDCRSADIISEILHGSGDPAIFPFGISFGQQNNLIDYLF